MAGRPAKIKLGWNPQGKYGYYYIRPPIAFIEMVAGWGKDHSLSLEYDYNEDSIIIRNTDRRHNKRGMTEYMLGVKETQRKQLGNKKYKTLIRESLGADGRRVLAETDWSKQKLTYDVKLLHKFFNNYSKFLEQQKSNTKFAEDVFMKSMLTTLVDDNLQRIKNLEKKK